MDNEKKFLMYKDRPLVRSGNTIYYGDMRGPYVIMLQITSTKKEGDLELPEKVNVQLLDTDPTVSPHKRIVKRSEKFGIYSAMDLGAIWLERAIAEKNK